MTEIRGDRPQPAHSSTSSMGVVYSAVLTIEGSLLIALRPPASRELMVLITESPLLPAVRVSSIGLSMD